MNGDFRRQPRKAGLPAESIVAGLNLNFTLPLESTLSAEVVKELERLSVDFEVCVYQKEVSDA